MLGAVVVLLVAGGCRRDLPVSAQHKLLVAVSILPQAWLVEQIGGEHVEVVTLVKPGESAEMYQPSDAQVSQVIGAAAYFGIGMPFESGRAFAALRAQGRPRVIDTREGIELREMGPRERDAHEAGHAEADAEGGVHDAHAHGGKDPHIWLSPRLLKIQACTVARTLGELDPAHRAAYDRNLAALEEKLDEAERTIRRTLEPLRGKSFFVFHPAWGYFADDYGLRQVAIEVEGKEPSDEEGTALQKAARQEGINVLFVQPQIAGRGAQAVAQAIGARLETLDPLEPDVLPNLLRAAQALADSYR